jgi:hypothetical protein
MHPCPDGQDHPGANQDATPQKFSRFSVEEVREINDFGRPREHNDDDEREGLPTEDGMPAGLGKGHAQVLYTCVPSGQEAFRQLTEVARAPLSKL